MDRIQKTDNKSVGEDIKKLEPSYMFGGIVKWCSHCGSLVVSQKVKYRILGTSLEAQWIGLHTPNAGGPGSIPGHRTRSHMHATTKEPACCY